jgi:mono/diheme cytochrome c family protein
VPPPAGSIPRGDAGRRAALAGPGPAATPALLARGAARYAIFCAPCHGQAGQGDGPAVAHGLPRPAPIAGLEAARSMAALAENLAGSHPAEDRIAPEDRWAIARFVAAMPRGGG